MAGSDPWLRRRSGVPSASTLAMCGSGRGGLPGGSGRALGLDVVGEGLELGQVVTGGLTGEEVATSKRSRPVRWQDGCQRHGADSNGLICTENAEISAFAQILAAAPIARSRDRSTRVRGLWAHRGRRTACSHRDVRIGRPASDRTVRVTAPYIHSLRWERPYAPITMRSAPKAAACDRRRWPTSPPPDDSRRTSTCAP